MASQGFGPSYYAVLTGPLLDDRELSANAKILYASITTMTDRKGYCAASNHELADRFGWGERTVTRLVSQLQERGFVRYVMRTNEETGKTERRIYIGSDAADGVAKIGECSQKWRGGIAKSGESINRNNKHIYKPPIIPQEVIDAVKTYAGDDADLETALIAFLKNRAAPPKPNPVKTAYGMNRLLKTLTDLAGSDRQLKLALIGKAVERNWLSFYQLRDNEMPKQVPAGSSGGGYGWQR